MKKLKAVILLSFLLSLMIPATVFAKESNETKLEYKNEIETKYISQSELEDITAIVGLQYDLNPCLLQALVERESSGNIYAVNYNETCFGLCQIYEKFHKERMDRLNVTDLYDAYSNILVAADYISELMEENDDDIYLVLMKYNMKHQTAEKLYEQGIKSEYAQEIVDRANQLTLMK